MKKIMYLLLVCFLYGSCRNIVSNQTIDKANYEMDINDSTIQNKVSNQPIDKANYDMDFNDSIVLFIEKFKYKTSYTKNDIPNYILDTLKKMNGGKFAIGDITERDKINLSCVNGQEDKYDKLLNFIILSDTICLISHKGGGVGSYDVLDYFNVYQKYVHKRFNTNEVIDTKEKLIKCLQRDHIWQSHQKQ